MEAGQKLQLPLNDAESINMVWCPPGEFLMGYPVEDRFELSESGKFQHKVKLTKGFWLGATPVTQVQWKIVMGQYSSFYIGKETFLHLPVFCENWTNATDFCQRLTDFWTDKGILRTDQQVSLPSVAQWEYACRAGTNTHWYFGDDEAELENHAWYQKNSGNRLHPVGLKLPNPWGLYDVYGQILEWCLDDLHIYRSNELTIDPIHQNNPKPYSKMVKGGCFHYRDFMIGSSGIESVAIHNPFNEETGIRIILSQ